MSFLKPRTVLTLEVTHAEPAASHIKRQLETLLKNCSPEELALLAQASSQPLIKGAAINHLRKIL